MDRRKFTREIPNAPGAYWAKPDGCNAVILLYLIEVPQGLCCAMAGEAELMDWSKQPGRERFVYCGPLIGPGEYASATLTLAPAPTPAEDAAKEEAKKEAHNLRMREKPNAGHGHVYKRADGVRAPCGGPGACPECSVDEAKRFCAEQAMFATHHPDCPARVGKKCCCSGFVRNPLS